MSLINEKSSKIELFEFQNWDVYKRSLLLTKELFLHCKQLSGSGHKNLADQLNRAASSIPLNLAEGVSRFSLKDKINFWRISKGSLSECVAIMDLSHIVTNLEIENKEKLIQEMAEIGKMLSGLIRWAEKQKN